MKPSGRGQADSGARFSRFGIQAASLVGIETVVTHRLLILGRDVTVGGGEEVGGGEDLEVALGAPTASGLNPLQSLAMRRI